MSSSSTAHSTGGVGGDGPRSTGRIVQVENCTLTGGTRGGTGGTGIFGRCSDGGPGGTALFQAGSFVRNREVAFVPGEGETAIAGCNSDESAFVLLGFSQAALYASPFRSGLLGDQAFSVFLVAGRDAYPAQVAPLASDRKAQVRSGWKQFDWFLEGPAGVEANAPLRVGVVAVSDSGSSWPIGCALL